MQTLLGCSYVYMKQTIVGSEKPQNPLTKQTILRHAKVRRPNSVGEKYSGQAYFRSHKGD